VDSFVCRLVHRLRLLRSQDTLPADGFLLTRPSGRYALIRKLRTFWRDLVATVGIAKRIVPHQLRHYAESRTMPNGTLKVLAGKVLNCVM
jgi:hypothetical protein